jgi:microcystin-dependent protein
MEGVIGFTTLFAGNFAPKNWAICGGQIINIASNTALFSILGTTYGGNGTTTFALPDLRGRTIVGVGTGPGLSSYSLGEVTGVETTALTIGQMPVHVHPFSTTVTYPVTTTDANQNNPNANVYGRDASGNNVYSGDNSIAMKPYAGTLTMAPAGGSTPFQILRPFLGLNQIICMYGVYPARN